MDTTPYTLPLIHLNGSGRERLSEDYTALYRAAKALVDAFCDVEFHPRDYYPLEDGAFEKARNDRAEIKAAIYQVLEYANHHRLHCRVPCAAEETPRSPVQSSSAS